MKKLGPMKTATKRRLHHVLTAMIVAGAACMVVITAHTASHMWDVAALPYDGYRAGLAVAWMSGLVHGIVTTIGLAVAAREVLTDIRMIRKDKAAVAG